eukprot:Sdes_comp20920_c0_seq6m18296
MVKNSPSSVFKLVRTGTQESLREIAANSFQQTICEGKTFFKKKTPKLEKPDFFLPKDPIEILSPIEIALNQSSLQVDYKNSSRDDHFSNVHVTNHMKFTGNYYNYVKKNACFSSSPTGEKFPSPHQKKTLQKSQKSEWYANSVCGFAALGGFLFGYDVGVMSGVILMPSFQDTFGGFQVSNDSSSANKVAWLISCLLLSASLSALIAGSIADKFGRHWCLVFSTVLFFMSCAAQASAQSYAVILISRTLSGFSVGLLSVVVPLYNAEISPASIRGRLVTFEQLAYSSGVLVSYVMNFFVSHLSEGWRYSLSVQCGIAFIFAIGMFFLPESPRWYLFRAKRSLSPLSFSLKSPSKAAPNESIRGSNVRSEANLFKARRGPENPGNCRLYPHRLHSIPRILLEKHPPHQRPLPLIYRPFAAGPPASDGLQRSPHLCPNHISAAQVEPGNHDHHDWSDECFGDACWVALYRPGWSKSVFADWCFSHDALLPLDWLL